MINEEVVNQIGERFERITGASKRKSKQPDQVERQSDWTEPSVEMKMATPERIIEEKVEEIPQVISAPEPGQQASVEPIERLDPQEASWETDIGSFHVKIEVPIDILHQAGLSPWETRTKIAGTLAAQTLQKYPELAFSPSQDQVVLWSNIRNSILSAFEQHAAAAPSA